MDKKCAACGKTVYPLEQLKCLDQIWHKLCFKCEVCGMTLNMRNYKGLEKRPYCNAHYPQPKAYTFVSDNPEMQRVKQNTAVISNVQYHSEFEKAKGRYTAVTDDPESIRHKQNAQVTSNAAYTGKKHQTTPGQQHHQQPQQHGGYSSPVGVNSSYTGQSTVYTSSSIGRRQRNSLLDQQPQQPQQPSPPPQPQFEPQSQPQPQAQPQRQPQSHRYQPQPTYSGDPDRMSGGPDLEAQERRIFGGGGGGGGDEAAAGKYSEPSGQSNDNGLGRCYRALYDYSAGDNDEVSFVEGDTITNGDPIDDGWMYGIVKRTGEYGMLPSNYVEESHAV